MTHFLVVSPWALPERHAALLAPQRPRVRIAIGGADVGLQANQASSARLAALAIQHDFTVLPGVAHETLQLLDALGDAYWAWLRAMLPGP